MRSLLSVVVLLAPVTAPAAPAPLPPRSSSHAEAVFDAGTPERARVALVYLRSRVFVEQASYDGRVASRMPDTNSSMRREWIEERLQVDRDGTRLRLRLSGGAGALAVLRALADRLSKAGMAFRQHAGRLRDGFAADLQALRALRERFPDRVSVEKLEQTETYLGHYELLVEPLKVLIPPRPAGSRR